ncbi:hypothetical protein [Leptolyngbya ohadii]|uniref:hypothetical protein n=1 Tax=Leptolyngbya ohadii TaxID=1962290 RepID=UPI0015C5CE3B|nr:hypothetical protein [Leptolyngbya ohadii]
MKFKLTNKAIAMLIVGQLLIDVAFAITLIGMAHTDSRLIGLLDMLMGKATGF